MNRIIHFEIHAENPERAAKFYKDVFDWEIKGWREQPYWLIRTGPENEKGINGGMMRRKGDSPKEGDAVNGFVNIIDVSSVDEWTKKIITAGGVQALAKIILPNLGYSAYFKDTEGNIFGIFENNSEAK